MNESDTFIALMSEVESLKVETVLHIQISISPILARLEDPARMWKARRAMRAPPSILRAGEMRLTKVEATPTAMCSSNFRGLRSRSCCNQTEAITLCCLITVPPTRCVDACLAVTARSELKESRPYTEAMTIRLQQLRRLKKFFKV